jgi:decaprenylphospho-beta-D-erythro-pentofuranosid-2-ulose 2-reductase
MSAAQGEKVIVLGGTSEIALAIVAELQAREPRRVGLLGRDPAALAGAASELERLGGREAWTARLDAHDTERHEQELAEAFARAGGVDVVIVAVGKLGERGTLLEEIPGALDILQVNTVGTASLVLHAARLLRAQEDGGTLIVLSSSAAWRARPSNVAYGASKAGLDALADGLATMLAPEGVRVVVVRPGFVHTRMTSGLPPAPFAITPQKVARRVVDKLSGSATVIWAPAVMRPVMALARALPRSLFRRAGG